ncbi:MAG TPA: tyrosine--tRNA ligase [candidate division Zixibacteria bacterium]|nr:tyrosine--tRNA ligase [candidate division Zixibacteria bacterium]
MLSFEKQLEIIKSNTVDLLPEGELENKLKRAIKEGKPLRVKQGFDPTAPDIHLGHTVGLRKLKQFQDLGHTIVLIIGDYTAMVGDPSGRSATRPQLTREQVAENAETYQNQFFKLIDREKTEVHYNGEWFAQMSFADILRLASQITVARILERDDFEKRYKSGAPIAVHELLYPLMQAYDSVAIKADIEIGGTEQLFNLLTGRQIQEAFGVEPQVALTLPILEGIDGVQRMSKSIGNYIGIAEDPKEIFGKIMSIPDDLIVSYFRLCTDADQTKLDIMAREIERGKTNPMMYKKELGETIIEMYHSKDAAQKARADFESVFSKREIPDDMPEIKVRQSDFADTNEIYWPKFLADHGLMDSSSKARNLIKQGGFQIDGEKQSEFATSLPFEGEHILKVGKLRWAKLIIN